METTMSEPTTIHDTFVLERHYPLPPNEVFAALADPDLKRRWFAEGEHPAESFEMDFRVGGAERTHFRLGDDTPFPGTAIVTEGRYEEIAPGHRVVVSSTMTLGDRRISTTLVTYELVESGGGTDLILTHQAAFYEGAYGPEMRKDGWEKMLASLDRQLGAPVSA
jgi:uncharacterized protein YndB with AHSA1/START domain